MAKIDLHNGRGYAIVDDGDYDSLSQFLWSNSSGYASRRDGDNKFYMHREVVNANDGDIVDHINRDTLDNRRCNLRICDHAGNMANSKNRSHNKTGYRGVWYDKKRGKFAAAIRKNGKTVHLGRFEDAIDAANAFDDAARSEYGEYAVLNFSISLEENR